MDLALFIKDNAMPISAVLGLVISLFQWLRDRKEKIRAQAEQISAWWVRVDDDHRVEKKAQKSDSQDSDNKFELPPHKDASRYYVGIVLLNQSQTPIRNLAVYGEAYIMKKGRRYKNELKRCEQVKTLLLQPILVPGEFISFTVVNDDKTDRRPWTYPEELSAIKESIGKVRPIINDEKWKVDTFIFEDAAGRCWIRRENGKLSRYKFYKWLRHPLYRVVKNFMDDDQSSVNPLNYKECFKKNKTREVSVYSWRHIQ